jgi:Flp pilus assembly protein TadG
VKTNSGTHSRKGFLSRLRQDQSGNVIALLAAAVFPAIAIIGGAVDMSRIYITRTSLQAACDAGSLMGRRVMGNSTWTANSNIANTKAVELFDANFRNGYIGTTNRTRSFSETNGNVTGRATARVPMTLMSVFGIQDKIVTVTCDAEMRIPASDIMFVLDTTGSMNCPENGSACPSGNNNGVEASNAKIKGLRRAASCFYEALAKQNITAYSAADCGEAANPVGATTDVRLRFGFTPYAANVNVGKLLPLNYIADQWAYQSREAVFEVAGDPDAYDGSYGTETAYSPVGSPTTANVSNIGWTDISQNLTHSNGQIYSYLSQRNTCVTVPSESRTYLGTYNFLSQSPATPVYPTASVTRNHRRIDTTANYSYRYRSYRQGSKNYCQLQYSTTNTVETTRNFTTTRPVNWTFNPSFDYWDYKKKTFNIAGLKNTANKSWRNSLTLPIGNSGTSTSVNWNGCIEERKTARVNDNDPSDNWYPVPTDALDMDIEAKPTTDPDTQWGPLLGGAIYTRYKYDDGWSASSSTFRTNSNSTYTSVSYGSDYYFAGTVNELCPTEAKLYSEMDATAFSTYISSLETGGNTYHDIGLLWGARLMAPKGIFSSVTSDTNAWVERHMIFMTDGDTTANSGDYSAHGVHWWDRRQNAGTYGPDGTWIEANINARTQALCRWVRNENITLWVVAFGAGISEETKTALESCATPGRYFEAANTAGLVTEFKKIANSISALRLTQ